MRWKGRQKSRNIEDQRHHSSPRMGGMGGAGLLRLLPLVYRMLGLKGTAILVACLGAYGLLSGNLGSMLGVQGGSAEPSSSSVKQSAQEKEQVEFVSVILADTEQTWAQIFGQQGKVYKAPRLVLFRDSVKSACGMADSAMGPFYCPGDQKVYIDLAFFDALQNRLNAPGDFAQAYVVAHEVGHHLQTLLGISAKVHAQRQKVSETEGNKLSVRQELQADCFAGVWAYHANRSRQMLEAGDIEEGLNAASAIGDDTLQKQSKGHVTPDSFTHGRSAQRVEWFSLGFKTGEMSDCNTFAKNVQI